MIEDDTFVIKGMTPLVSIPDKSVGRILYEKLLQHCSNNVALIDAASEKRISYKTLLEKTCSLAESLRKSGYGSHNILAICSENCIEFFISVIAAMYIGATFAPVNNNYTLHELVHVLNISKPQLIFCSKQTLPKLRDLKQKFRFKIIVINSDENESGEECLNSFVAKFVPENQLLHKCFIEDVPLSHVAFILCSSGTTGLPKGVMLTHENTVSKFPNFLDGRFSFEKSGSCRFIFLPAFHLYGLFASIKNIYEGAQMVVMNKFDEHIFLRTIEKYKISVLPLVPPLALFLARSPLVDKYDLSSVKEILSGAAPLDKATEEVLKKRLKVQIVRQAYGLTETGGATMFVPNGEQKHGSSGKVLPNLLCKIRDPVTRKSLGPKQIGEICLKGPVVMKGYYGDEEATRNSFTSDGWLLTGDLGYYDEDEFFYITGRLKELIKYKGFQVAPAELEAILLTNPKIKDAAVVGLPNKVAGELPLAFVVRNPNVTLTEKDVESFLADKVSSHKKLRGGVLFISEIPKNPSGKIMRRKLQELLKTKYNNSKL